MSEEEEQLRSAALKNAKEILAARQRADEELIRAKEALELKTRELAHSLGMMRATLEAVADGVLATDGEGRITEFNERYWRMWEIPPTLLESRDHRLVLQTISKKFDDPQTFLAGIEQLYSSSMPETFHVLKLTSGQVFERYSRVQWVDGRNVGRVWSFRDITRQNRAENMLEQRVADSTAELQTSERQFQQLVAGVTDYAIYMLSVEGNIVNWNSGAERIKGYTSKEIIGRNFSQFYTEEDRATGLPQRALETARTRGKFEGEAWRVRKDGTRFWASVLIDPIRDSQGTLIGYAKVTRDMTEHRAMQEQLHQSQKMEAIGQLTGGVAHDFNNLLTVILGNLESIWRHIPAEDNRVRRAVDQASRGAQRAAKLTQQLLAFARRQPLNPKPTEVNRLVTDMSDLLRRTLGENVAIEAVLGAGLWRVDVDSNQLESALLNLAVNSRDAMPSGGKLTVETANTHIDENYTRGFAEISAGQYVVICVSDTGTGMPKDVMGRAFDPFYTTKPIGQGTGLGLSQVYGFVKQSGGHVKIYSEPGHGTTVKIYLPRLLVGEPIEEQVRPAIVPQGRATETILVVEDDDDVRIYSTESLRELGFTVLEASNAQSALRVLEHHPEINLLFTDVGLPGVNGGELADQARRRRPNLKVLFTTGYARNAIVHQGRLDPGVELLTKPFSRAQLANRIRDVLDLPSPTPANASKVALVAEDEELVRMFLVESLRDLHFEVVQAPTAAQAFAAAQANERFDVAIIDVGLPDRSGAELALELRSRWPQLPIVIASGYGSQQLEGLLRDEYAVFLAKPYDEVAVKIALQELGIQGAGE